MMKFKSIWFWTILLIFITLVVSLFTFEVTREYIFSLFTESYLFAKDNIIAILTAFFLVKGKFVIKLFLRKILLLSATGLGKRYMIERVLTHNFKVHFMDHMEDDFKRVANHVKHNFREFPLVKKIMTLFAFLGSLGFIGKFMGGMLAIKVFIAKIWSFLLAVFLKIFTALFYFITKVLWGSWLSPIFEIVVFSWLLTWMERIPFLKRGLNRVYVLFAYMFGWIEEFVANLMKAPLRKFLKWLVKNMKIAIYKFIGYERVSRYKRLQNFRKLNPNSHTLIVQKRVERVVQKVNNSAWKRLEVKREKRKPLNKIGF